MNPYIAFPTYRLVLSKPNPPTQYLTPQMSCLRTSVMTDDGPGIIINYGFRKNTNGSPGVKQYVVKLTDGRIRRYSSVKEMGNPENA